MMGICGYFVGIDVGIYPRHHHAPGSQTKNHTWVFYVNTHVKGVIGAIQRVKKSFLYSMWVLGICGYFVGIIPNCIMWVLGIYPLRVYPYPCRVYPNAFECVFERLFDLRKYGASRVQVAIEQV